MANKKGKKTTTSKKSTRATHHKARHSETKTPHTRRRFIISPKATGKSVAKANGREEDQFPSQNHTSPSQRCARCDNGCPNPTRRCPILAV